MPHLRTYTPWFAFWSRGSAQVTACWCPDATKHPVAPGFCSCGFWWHLVAWLLSYLARWFGLQLFLQCLGFGFTVKHYMLCLWWVPTSIHTYPLSWFLSMCSVLFLVGFSISGIPPLRWHNPLVHGIPCFNLFVQGRGLVYVCILCAVHSLLAPIGTQYIVSCPIWWLAPSWPAGVHCIRFTRSAEK